MMEKIAVLLMAYGSPNSPDEIEPFYTEIRGGRKPSSQALAELVARYKHIGGRSPLLDITRDQARALQAQLDETRDRFRVYVGMKHGQPSVAQSVDEIRRDGLRRVVALVLAPFASPLVVDGYARRVQEAVQGNSLVVNYASTWNQHPLFLRAVAEKVDAARQRFGANDWGEEIQVIFSAHSLPARAVQPDDSYPRELREMCERVAALAGLRGWRLALQSAGRTQDEWLGPDILDVLTEIAAEGYRRALVAPIGFVAEHLEILYDIDVACAERARDLGIEMRRTEMLNSDPSFIAALAAEVRKRVGCHLTDPALPNPQSEI